MNKELDTLLCLLDGKITAYRMKNYASDIYSKSNYEKLLDIQTEVQKLWRINYDEK